MTEGTPIIENVLSRLQGVRQTATGAMARCPSHDDQTASLSISQGQDGRVLLKCFAGCDTVTIVERIGLQMCNLFPSKTQTTQTTTASKVVHNSDAGREYSRDEIRQ